MQRVKPLITIGLLFLLFALALTSVTRVFTKGVEKRAIDFHAYWYSGHFVWLGIDPYHAWVEERAIAQPIHYLDGPVSQGSVRQYHWSVTPSNTAPLLLLLSPLSRFSWRTAVTVWGYLNLVLAVLTPLLMLHLLAPAARLTEKLLVVFVALSLIATRQTIDTGQTSLLVLAFSLLALLWGPRQPLLAGLCLGMAMSKYSLAFPIFLLFAYKRWYLALLISLVVQAAGVVAVSLIGDSTIFETLYAYYRIMVLHASLEGMHLSAGLLKGTGWLGMSLLVAGTVALGAALWRWYRVRGRHRDTSQALSLPDLLLLIVGIVWNLLAVYHRRYDHVFMIVFIAVAVICIPRRRSFALSSRERVGVLLAIGGLVAIWILPLYYVVGLQNYVYLFNLSCLMALGLALFLLFKAEFRPLPIISSVTPS